MRAYPGGAQAHLVPGDTLITLKRSDEAKSADARAANLRFDEATMRRPVEALEASGKRDAALLADPGFADRGPAKALAAVLAKG
ncbi:MAG: hypothetical protein K2Y20_03565 [Sphingomonas sp.]|nr:hypothetical protein [Sphingomonas sp.]